MHLINKSLQIRILERTNKTGAYNIFITRKQEKQTDVRPCGWRLPSVCAAAAAILLTRPSCAKVTLIRGNPAPLSILRKRKAGNYGRALRRFRLRRASANVISHIHITL